MENYFVGYETVVHFISQEELDRDHKGIPHGGFVLRSGEVQMALARYRVLFET